MGQELGGALSCSSKSCVAATVIPLLDAVFSAIVPLILSSYTLVNTQFHVDQSLHAIHRSFCNDALKFVRILSD